MICHNKATCLSLPAAISYPEVTTSLLCYIKALPPTPDYEDHMVTMHESLYKANPNAINISTSHLATLW